MRVNQTNSGSIGPAGCRPSVSLDYGGDDVHVTTTTFRGWGRCAGVGLAACFVLTALAGTAKAQTAGDPNPGGLTFTGGFDVLPGAAYVFRGITQESDPGLTMWPYGDIGLAISSGDGAIKSVGLNFGLWNSLQTGSSGLDGPSGRLHYEEDFYTTLALGFGGGFTLGTTYTAYTSPNLMFGTVHEIAFKVSKAHWLNPYGTFAFEIDGQADGGADEGTYFELGVAPSWPLAEGRVTVAVPVKLGLSVSNYYEHPAEGNDSAFGFFDIGGLVTFPIGGQPGRFGSWNVHAGADVLFLGETTKYFNDGESTKFVGLFGIGVSY